ncbi:MAG: hypothetical protein ACOCU4_04195 [Alkalispirochaeta sp.]
MALLSCTTPESSLRHSAAADTAPAEESASPEESPSSRESSSPAESATARASTSAQEAPSVQGPPTADSPEPIAIDATGIPLEDILVSRAGVRLVYDVTGNEPPAAATGAAGPESSDAPLPPEVVLTLQPSRTARADISIHAPGAAGYLIMEETDTLWRPAPASADETPLAADDLVAAALSGISFPRYLPRQDQPFTSAGAPDEFLIATDDQRTWEVTYDSGTVMGIGEFIIEPMALAGGGPKTIVLSSSAERPFRLTLRSAAVYREREISGAVVSAFGRPLSDITVAPHPAVGRLHPSRVAVTDSFGAFTVPFRAAPGDSLRLYYGRTTGSGTEERITNPQEIRGRVASPDFATLIFTEE